MEWCSSTTLASMILGGVELRGIKDGRGLLDACSMVELSGVSGRPVKVDAWIPLEDGFVKDGGSDPNAVGLLDRCCSFFVNGRLERHSVFLCCALVSCQVVWSCSMVTPFISL